MTLNSYFADFSTDILPSAAQRAAFIDAHTQLRQRLAADEDLKPLYVTTFLQGSYRRWTAIRPVNGSRPDVDVVLVTRMHPGEYTPQRALDQFSPFLQRFYAGAHRQNGRSISIDVAGVKLDLVPTAAPSEAQLGLLKTPSVITDLGLEEAGDWRLDESWQPPDRRATSGPSGRAVAEWKTEPLLIPDRDARVWVTTDPLVQLQWTRDKNRMTNGHFTAVVRALKWWRKTMEPFPEHPKSFPFERLVGDCCPDGITSVAEGITLTLEMMVARYRTHAQTGAKPQVRDTGISVNDVLARVTAQDFASFYQAASRAAPLARRACDAQTVEESAELWRKLLGHSFPAAPSAAPGFAVPAAPSLPRRADFA